MVKGLDFTSKLYVSLADQYIVTTVSVNIGERDSFCQADTTLAPLCQGGRGRQLGSDFTDECCCLDR